MFAYQVLIPFLFGWVSGGFSTDEDDVSEILFAGATKGQVGNVPLVGIPSELIAWVIVNEFTDEELLEFGINSRENPMVEISDKVVRALRKYDTGKLEGEDVLELTLDLTDAFTGFGAENLFQIGQAGLELLDDPSKEEAAIAFGLTPRQAGKLVKSNKKKTSTDEF